MLPGFGAGGHQDGGGEGSEIADATNQDGLGKADVDGHEDGRNGSQDARGGVDGPGPADGFGVLPFEPNEARGLDFSMEAVRMAAERGLRGLIRGSTMTLPFPNDTFDLVTSIDVLYIKGVDDRMAMSEIRRVTKPGGVIVINVPAFEMLRGRHDAAVHTRHRYRKSEVAGLLQEHGFEVLKLSYWNMTLFPVMMAKRTMERLSRKGAAPASDMSDLPGPVNNILTALMRVENRMLLATGMPFGGSVFAVGTLH